MRHLQSVSYTHLDVYKRQIQKLDSGSYSFALQRDFETKEEYEDYVKENNLE